MKKNIITYIYNLLKYNFFYLETRLFFYLSSPNNKTILFPKIEDSMSVCIYGFGPYGEEYFLKLFKKNIIKGIYDGKYELMDFHVRNPEEIDSNSFDCIVVTVMNVHAREEIIAFLKKKGISEERIFFVQYM